MNTNKYIKEKRQKLLVNHVRECKTYCSNALKESLTRQERDFVLPDYYNFKQVMAPDVKAVAEVLEDCFKEGVQSDYLDRLVIHMEHLIGPTVETSYYSLENRGDTYFVELYLKSSR